MTSWHPIPTAFLSTDRTWYRPWCRGAILTALLIGLSGGALAGSADAAAGSALEPIVITARRLPEAVPDEIVRTRVESALHADRYFYDEHVTVTVKNGIVRLEGIVFDVGDVQDARRIIRKKVPGVKHVVNELEICACNGGGSG